MRDFDAGRIGPEPLEQIRQHRAQILARRGGHPLEIEAAELINAMRLEDVKMLLD